MLGGIKSKAGNYFLKKELNAQKRKAQVANLAGAKKIALLYQADDEEVYKKVKRYVKYLKEEEGIRKIMALGFSTEKETPFFLQAKLEFDHFTKKELNWYGKPAGTIVDNFIEEDYDIIIDLTMERVLPLRFILVNSKAKFKVGRYSDENEPYYDMMIAVSEENLDHYIKQINHYLKIINSGDGK